MNVKKLLLLLSVAAAAAAVIGVGHRELHESAPVEAITNDSLLLAVAKNSPFVNQFVTENPDCHHEITLLPPERVTQQSETYPVIYGNLPNKTLYRIDYKNGRGLFVIVDLENETVLRYFRTAGVSVE